MAQVIEVLEGHVKEYLGPDASDAQRRSKGLE
jgi:hypothetical protein